MDKKVDQGGVTQEFLVDLSATPALHFGPWEFDSLRPVGAMVKGEELRALIAARGNGVVSLELIRQLADNPDLIPEHVPGALVLCRPSDP